MGKDECAQCHQSEYESYLQTAHSEALKEVDVDQQPPEGQVFHQASGRSYRAYRENNQFRHREYIKSAGGDDVVIADHAMRYVIGSGNNAHTYVLEMDGFFFESPITWYASRQSWDMSPGYEIDPLQPGFGRPVTHECILCHSGRVEAIDNSLHRFKIHEHAIGCERCHGPGSLHVEHHLKSGESAAEFDDPIVAPDRLSRERQEAICGQCHLATAPEANVRGRSIVDFRPSLHLSDFCVRYQLQSHGGAMTVVGHIEQMRASRCYQLSPSMTCTTCHQMHDRVDALVLGRESCLACHAPNACGLKPADRVQQAPDDNCANCHMPQSATDIPHVAFRHHRIGIHKEPASIAPSTFEVGELVPIDDVTHLSEIDRKRCLGLAYMKLAKEGDVENPAVYVQRALSILQEVHEQGMRDAEVEAALARIYVYLGDTTSAIRHGRAALLESGLRNATRCDVADALSLAYIQQRDFVLASPFLEELSGLRYDSRDYLLLSICRNNSGDRAGALQAAKKAVRVEPHQPDLHQALAELYSSIGDHAQAEWHRQRSRRLSLSAPENEMPPP